MPADTPAARLAAAYAEFNHINSGNTKRNTPSPSSPRELLAMAAQRFASGPHDTHGLDKRSDGASSPADKLAAAAKAFSEGMHGTHGLIKRDTSSPAEKLAAAAKTFSEGMHGTHGLSKRDDSPADRLAAAAEQFRTGFHGTHGDLGLVRRADDEPSMPVSNMQKTVIPLVIGICLILLFGIVAGFIVYKRRQKNKAKEAAQHHRKNLDLEDDGADEDFEMQGGARVQDVRAGVGANRAGGWNAEDEQARYHHGGGQMGGQYQQQQQQQMGMGAEFEGGRRRTSSLTKGAEAREDKAYF